jgi:hypothetical protein
MRPFERNSRSRRIGKSPVSTAAPITATRNWDDSTSGAASFGRRAQLALGQVGQC